MPPTRTEQPIRAIPNNTNGAAPEGLVWEEPPPKGRAGSLPFPESYVEHLVRHQGEWARVREYPTKSSATTAAKKINTGHPKLKPVGKFEARGAVGGKGSYLYVRFTGRS